MMHACWEAALSTTLEKSSQQSLQLKKGGFTVKAMVFDASKEQKMTAMDWLDASGQYVKLLRQHLQGGDDDEPGGPTVADLADAWDVHFRCIQSKPNFMEQFEVYLV